MTADELKPFWISWYDRLQGEWELHSPWWISGRREFDGGLTICAAVMAEDEDHAKRLILACHDDPPDDLEWRFVREKPEGWSPFSDRFPPAGWMQWSPSA